MAQQQEYLVWMDLEMTGLEPQRDTIIEIATIISDSDLQEVATGPVVAIHQSDAILAGMDEWNQSHHTASGLVQRVRESSVSLQQAEQLTLDFISQYVAKGTTPLCGNSIWQDRRFLAQHMPALESYFHYRNIDVSSVKELAKRWSPDVYAKFSKNKAHLALDDIRESLAELRHYRRYLFR